MRAEEAIAHAAGARPVLIAGPTASGKSALALAIAEAHGGCIVNADALQVYGAWRVLTARPGPADLARAAHLLYGHVPSDEAYSVGRWLREVAPLLDGARPIIVGGTGLYFTALTEGLAKIPPIPDAIRAEADRRMAAEGRATLTAELDAATAGRIDVANPARVQRAWEVQRTTGKGLAAWQAETGPPLLPLSDTIPMVVDAPPERLNPRIVRRFETMVRDGALDEVAANLAHFDPARPADRAIGANELAAHLHGDIDLETAKTAAITATRRYAKKQRTWFRSRMGRWPRVTLD